MLPIDQNRPVKRPLHRGHRHRPPLWGRSDDLRVRVINTDEQRLHDTMRTLGHGRILDVPIRGGIPSMGPESRVEPSVRPGEAPEQLIMITPSLCRRPHPQHMLLSQEARRAGSGTFSCINVADGLPISWQLAA